MLSVGKKFGFAYNSEMKRSNSKQSFNTLEIT